MDRRTLFAELLGKTSPKTMGQPKSIANFKTLTAYTGTWEFPQAAHLLRRTMFGPSTEQINQAVGKGLNATINQLLDASVLPQEGPVNPGRWRRNGELLDVNDPVVAVGDAWVKKENGKWKAAIFNLEGEKRQLIIQSRRNSIVAWKTESILREEVSIYEKMTLFWNNHFALSNINSPFSVFFYIITLSENALGNFRELVKKITVDPAMLEFLNGKQNQRRAPNENYARELFELFTIGKGPLAGPGDYTYYTEEDIAAAARVLTGWRDASPEELILDLENGTVELSTESLVSFRNFRHDKEPKQFSHRFNNQIINDEGPEEYCTLIDMIFEQPECARFIARKLYRWFVYYEISEEIEAQIIEPLAQIIIDNDYEIKPALETLLKSEHFYDSLNLGPMIKNPYDFVTSIMKPFNFPKEVPNDPLQKLYFYRNLTRFFSIQQMDYFNPPDVAGWKAYYQEPLFYRTWINTTTLNFKMQISRGLSFGLNPNQNDGGPKLNVLAVADNIENATEPDVLIEALATQLYPQPLTNTQKDFLKGVLLPGLPDFEWTIEYGDYLAASSNQDLRESVELKLRQLMNAMLSMPEFYLS